MATLVFDYDGTLHDCARIYCPAFRETYKELVRQGKVPFREISDEEIASWLGWSAKEMWETFAPFLPEEDRWQASAQVGDGMLRRIRQGEARLYPGVEEVLTQLKESGHTLLFLSNCKRSYLAAHRETFSLDRWFSDYFCAEAYDWVPKPEIFTHLTQRHPGPYLIIGDRFHDMEIAQVHHLPSIGCLYGYGEEGEFEKTPYVAPSPQALPALVEEIFPR